MVRPRLSGEARSRYLESERDRERDRIEREREGARDEE
jgi:hypothetical protein